MKPEESDFKTLIRRLNQRRTFSPVEIQDSDRKFYISNFDVEKKDGQTVVSFSFLDTEETNSENIRKAGEKVLEEIIERTTHLDFNTEAKNHKEFKIIINDSKFAEL